MRAGMTEPTTSTVRVAPPARPQETLTRARPGSTPPEMWKRHFAWPSATPTGPRCGWNEPSAYRTESWQTTPDGCTDTATVIRSRCTHRRASAVNLRLDECAPAEP